jgi:hypothetical protein
MNKNSLASLECLGQVGSYGRIELLIFGERWEHLSADVCYLHLDRHLVAFFLLKKFDEVAGHLGEDNCKQELKDD